MSRRLLLIACCASLSALAGQAAGRPAAPAVRLTGEWRVGPLIEPKGGGGGGALPQDAREDLLASDLPFPGDTVKGRGGRLCAPDRCLDVRWKRMTVQAAFGRKPAPAGLKLKPAAPAYALVEDGKTKAFALQRADGHLLFPIPLCDKAEICRTAFADWAPTSKDAALGPVGR